MDALAAVSCCLALSSVLLDVIRELDARKQAFRECCSQARWLSALMYTIDRNVWPHRDPLDRLQTSRTFSHARLRITLALGGASLAALGIYLADPLASSSSLTIPYFCDPPGPESGGKDPVVTTFSSRYSRNQTYECAKNTWDAALKSDAGHEAYYPYEPWWSGLSLSEGSIPTGPASFAELYTSYGISMLFVTQAHLHHRYQPNFLIAGTLAGSAISFIHRPRANELLYVGAARVVTTLLLSLMLSLLFHRASPNAQRAGEAYSSNDAMPWRNIFDNEKEAIFSGATSGTPRAKGAAMSLREILEDETGSLFSPTSPGIRCDGHKSTSTKALNSKAEDVFLATLSGT